MKPEELKVLEEKIGKGTASEIKKSLDAYDAIQETEAAKWKKIKETRDLPHVTAITQNRRN